MIDLIISTDEMFFFLSLIVQIQVNTDESRKSHCYSKERWISKSINHDWYMTLFSLLTQNVSK